MEIIPLNLDTIDEISDRTGIDSTRLLDSYLETSLVGKTASYVFYTTPEHS